jgi:putative tryptophan/tyrosine transport system substrate-binding protein
MQAGQVRRREFITLLGSSAVSWPLGARAQQVSKRPLIGFLGPTAQAVARTRIAAFEQRLNELGWVPGQNLAIEYRWAEGKTDRYAGIAAELARLKVDVITTWGTETAVAAKQATSTIPIIFTVVGDPVGSGLVDSLARPGGNVTGLSTQHDDTAGRRLQMLHEVVPILRQLAIMGNRGNSGGVLDMREARAAARALGIAATELDIRRAEDILPAFASITGQVQALYVAADALFNSNRSTINGLALEARLPTMHGFPEIVSAGGLMSYSANYVELFRRTADYVGKILRGTKPSDIPVEQPTKFDLVLNLKTARALGLPFPDKLLALADEVIE